MLDDRDATDPAGAPEGPRVILCVDDEPNILSALRRLLRAADHRVLTAPGGAEGLELMEREPVDLVISDMRMPEMDGARFLAMAAERWPDVPRILLTGYSDLDSTVAAVNQAGIYRYISKPWEDADLKLTVQRALEAKALDDERRRLRDLTERQNAELRELNASLEQKVADRTAELSQTAQFLEVAYDELKAGYRDAVKVFTNLIELREGRIVGHSRRVAGLARRIAEAMGLDEDTTQVVHDAGLLHDIGKIGVRDSLIGKSYHAMTPAERQEYARHTVTGYNALTALPPLHAAARVVRSHHEHFDGSGYPDRLKGERIPLGARILAVADDFDGLQNGTLLGKRFSLSEARKFIKRYAGRRYDPRVVEAFQRVVEGGSGIGAPEVDTALPLSQAARGMVLTRDLVANGGILLLTRGQRLSDILIERLRKLEREEGWRLEIHVRGGDTGARRAAG